MRSRTLFLLLVFSFLFAGCGGQKGDYFAPFRGQYEAQIEGEWMGIPFSGCLVRTENSRTLTFYAPQTLADTVLLCEGEGALFLTVAGLRVPLEGDRAAGFAALLGLFPETGEIKEITREKDGICLNGVGFSLKFAPDGTPLAASNATAQVRVKRWG